MERGQGRESGPVSRAEAPQRLSAEEQEVMRQIERFGGSMSREEWDALEATDIHRYGQRMERSRQRTRR